MRSFDIGAAVDLWPSWEEMEATIRRLCEGKPAHLARCLKETKGKYVDKEGLREQLSAIQRVWPELRGLLAKQIIPFDEVYSSLKKVGAPYEPEMICVSREHLRETFSLIPFMRSRYTGIDLIHRLGLLPELEEKLFGKGGIWQVSGGG